MINEVFWNYCKWNATAGGNGNLTVAGAAATDGAGTHDIPANCSVVDGNQYRYYARSSDGTQVEWGLGTTSAGGGVFTRSTIILNSDNTNVPVNFLTAPIVDMFPRPQKTVESPTFPSGTYMLFENTNAPLGWVKRTDLNDYAIRVVSGSVGGGGVNTFSSTFQYRTSDGAGLSVAMLAQHLHGPLGPFGGQTNSFVGQFVGTPGFGNVDLRGSGDLSGAVDGATGYTGSNAPHAHTYDMRVLYVDFIIARKS